MMPPSPRFAPALVALLATAVSAQDWPAFRGPSGNGVAAAQTVPSRWSPSENIRWRRPLPRPANGSPIVSGDRIFLTGAEDPEGKRRALYCFDRRSGELQWTRRVTHDAVMPTHKTNPYGGTTPAADGERVVVWHASAGLHCYDFAGKRLWHRELGSFRHPWGYGTSPVIHGSTVILHSGPGAAVFVAAFDLATGKTIWKTEEPVQGNGHENDEGRLMGSWCTPLIATVDGGPQILCTLSTRLVAYHPGTGEILWHCAGLPCKRGDLAYSSPSIAGDVCLILGGYEGPEIGIRLDHNRGDVTGTRRLWRTAKRPSNCGSGVVVDGHLYIPDMRGVISCVKPATGKRLWSERATKGAIWSSIVFADGKLFVTNQRGATIVFRPNPAKLDLLTVNELHEPTNATPAFAGGEIFLRTDKHLFCIGQAEKAAPATGAEIKNPGTTGGRRG